MQAALLFPFGFAIAQLVFAPQNDGKRGMGAGPARRGPGAGRIHGAHAPGGQREPSFGVGAEGDGAAAASPRIAAAVHRCDFRAASPATAISGGGRQ